MLRSRWFRLLALLFTFSLVAAACGDDDDASGGDRGGQTVEVKGWDVDAADGLFTGSFTDMALARTTAETLLDEEVDMILPVGGAINLPAGDAISERELDAALIGVDVDAFEAMDEQYQDLWLTTIEKDLAGYVTDAIAAHATGAWASGFRVGTLANEGVSLAPYHSWEDEVPSELSSEIDDVKASIIAGDIEAATYDPTFGGGEPLPEVEAEGGEATPVKACLVTDLAGVDDRSFNASAWQGVQDAVEAGYATEDSTFLESDAAEDWQPNIDNFLSQDCEHIVTVGFALGEVTDLNAAANPDINWTMVDNVLETQHDNVVQNVYQTDEAAFLAGYLAAGMSKTGVLGTYGGDNFPTVSIFMDGFTRGADYYNEVKGGE